jgi:hypothetical protein
MSGFALPFCSISAIAMPIDNISFITPHGPFGLAHVTANPTIGAAATIVFHSSGVKSDLLAIEFASFQLPCAIPTKDLYQSRRRLNDVLSDLQRLTLFK